MISFFHNNRSVFVKHNRQRQVLALSIFICLGLLLGLVGEVQPVRAATYVYTQAPLGGITDDGTIPSGTGYCSETGWPNTRYFIVDENFTVSDLNVVFVATHVTRGQIQVRLTSSADPSGATVSQIIVASSADGDNNYNIRLDADSTNALDDNNADAVPGTTRTVGQTLLNSFEGRNAKGVWRMDICDNTSGDTGTLVSASLEFTGDPISITPPSFTQGPPVLETYYIPWPEDQLWQAMDTIYYPGRPVSEVPGDTIASTNEDDNYCLSYAPLSANPRMPMIGYTSVTIVEAGTIIYFDHWEDDYEQAVTFPTQPTTEVWGDGILTNGRAPGDADDVLSAGQIVVLYDAKDIYAATEVIDYDASDKIASTKPVAVTRASWANGSVTLFGQADEVYPTSLWGDYYVVPVGETTNTDYFQYTGAFVMAEEDGTVVYFDRNNDGSPDVTVTLNEGEGYLWDDKYNATGIMGVNNVIGNGLIAGSRIYTADGKLIQVSLLTADVCAGFEARSYSLLPYEKWSHSYYNPVSTPGTEETTIHLYNPGTSAITVAYAYDTGYQGAVSVPAGGTNTITMADGEGARFYAVSGSGGTITNNVRDNFDTNSSYAGNNGSVSWNGNWVEVNENDGAASGDVRVIGNELRIGEDGNAGIYRTANLSGATSATLSFNFREAIGDISGVISVQVSTNGTDWTTIGSVDYNDTNSPRSYNLTSGQISSTTSVRFIITSVLEGGEFIYFDNVDISYTTPAPPTPSDAIFYAVGTVDAETDGGAYDWGFSLVPGAKLSPYLIVGWAPGWDPAVTSGTDTAPIWLTGGRSSDPSNLTPFTVCIDYNGDGGPNTDSISGRTYNTTLTLTPNEQEIVYDPDGNQTGMQLWVCDAAAADAVLTATWGADPSTAPTGRPAMDMGYTIRNLVSWQAPKGVELLDDDDGDGKYSEGDTIRYTIIVRNRGAGILANTFNVSDSVPDDVTYVPDSTYVVYADSSTAQIPDGTSPIFPLDEANGGWDYDQALAANTEFSIYFDATINVGVQDFPYKITNVATVTALGLEVFPEVDVSVQAGPTGLKLPDGPFGFISDDVVNITWETFNEEDLFGFKVWRDTVASAERVLVCEVEAERMGTKLGTVYDDDCVDTQLEELVVYEYWLEVLFRDGTSEWLGPTSRFFRGGLKFYLPTILN